MQDALAPDALAELVAGMPGGMLLAFDLDGTLAPIVARPQEARVPDDVQQMLAALAVRGMVWFTPRYLVGNHGAEGVPGHEAQVPAYGAMCREWLAALRANGVVERLAGVLLEDKTYSLSLHYRLARDPEAARATLLGAASQLSPPPRVVTGKRVLNLVPPGAPHKGEALRELIAHARVPRALYVGDDMTDEDVFALRLPGVHTVRVEPDGDSAADYMLQRQADVARLLRALLRAGR